MLGILLPVSQKLISLICFVCGNLGILGVKFYMKLKGTGPLFNETIKNSLFGYSGYCIELVACIFVIPCT